MPIGTWQPPPRAARAARSAVTANRVVGVVEKCEGGDGLRIVLAGFDAEGSLARGGTEIFGFETFANPFCFLKAVEAGSGEKDCVDLAFGKLAQTGVDVAAKLNGLNIGTQRFQLRAASLTAGADDCALRQCGETAVLHRDEHIAGIDSRRSRGQREGLRQFGWQILERMDGEIARGLRRGPLQFPW